MELEADLSAQALSIEVMSVEEWNRSPRKS